MANNNKEGLSGEINGELHFGADGVTYTPHMEGTVLSWTNDGNRENPEPVDLKGPQGDPGPQGEPGKTPVRGEDYWTKEDRQAIIDGVMLTVTIDSDTGTASHSASEIKAHLDAGGHAILKGKSFSGSFCYQLRDVAADYVLFQWVTNTNATEIRVYDDKTYSETIGMIGGGSGTASNPAYDGAVDAGYVGTEADFAKKLAADYVPMADCSEYNALALVAETGLVEPVADENGAILTDEDGNILII